MGFINPGRNNNSRIAGIRLRDRPSCPPTKGPRCPPKRPPKRSRPSSSSSTSTPHRHTPPPPPPLSRFESLPTEILHSIFTHSHNLHLARASPHLARTLAARSLQLSYVRAQHGDAAGLSHALTLRFFSTAFLALWEARFARRLDCTAAAVPLRGLMRDTALGAALFARGAVLAPDQREAHLEVLHGAVTAGRVEVVRLLVETGGLTPSKESLRLAMRTGGLDVCGVLVKGGADVRDVGVWREVLALGRGEEGEKAVAWLVREGAVPPGEVLGELSQREEGVGEGEGEGVGTPR